MEEMMRRNWGAEELVLARAERYAGCTARPFIDLKELWLADPEVLGL